MNGQKIQITLTPQETTSLSLNPLGYDVSRFVKFLAGQAALSLSDRVPTFKMSKKLEKLSEKALEEYRQGKLKNYDSTKEMFADL